MNIVIFGGLGFIGRHLTERLRQDAGNRITVFDRSQPLHTASDDNVRYIKGEFVQGAGFDDIVSGSDMVIHLVSTSVPANEQGALSEIQANVIPSIELFESCVRCSVSTIIFLSSGGTVYGDSKRRQNSESDLPDPINTYGLQKVLIEASLRQIAHAGDTHYNIVRLSNPYGPGQNPQGPLGLITKMVYSALNHEVVHIFGDGSVIRDFIYIQDAVDAIMDVIRLGETNTIYNVGCGVGTSVGQVVQTLESVLPETIRIAHDPPRCVDVPYSVLNIDKYRQISTLSRFTPLEEGIEKTYDYFKEQQQ